MDDKEKTYSQEIVQENPFPGEVLQSAPLSTQSTPAGTYTPTVAKEKTMPTKRVAVELLSSALNTRSKKILQEFQFTPSGSIQIGDFKEGLTGDLRLTPNGLTARDVAGLTTFAIDGTTGDAIFKGEVQAGTFISGLVVVGNNSVIINGESRNIIVNDGSNDRIGIGNV